MMKPCYALQSALQPRPHDSIPRHERNSIHSLSLSSIPVEILEIIAQYLPKPCLLSLRLTSHLLSCISTRVLFPVLVQEILYQHKTYLHTAISSHHHTLISQLLKAKAPPHFRGINNCTSLHTAARANCIFSVRLLLQYGADVDAEDKFAWTPLQLAARFGYEDMVSELIEKGADVNKGGFHGWTALYYAVREGYKRVAGLLSEDGAREIIKDAVAEGFLESCSTREEKKREWGQWSPL